MRSFNHIAVAAVLCFVAAGCGRTSVSGRVEGADSLEVRKLAVNTYEVLDTVRTSAGGDFRYRVDVSKGQPEFIYLFHKDVKVASLLLERGEKALVEADTLGNYTVSGSAGSETLALFERGFAAFLSDLEKAETPQAYARRYIDYYREALRFVMQNKGSLAVIPALYARAGEFAPVFAQSTDAVVFRSVCDTLSTIYPDSRYVKALESETVRREKELEIYGRLKDAREVGFPDLEINDVEGRSRKLSEVDAKVIMVHFWTSADGAQGMFNLEILKPVYRDYHSRGFEIYSVGIDNDKARWASCVKGQNLPWINVCDGRGLNSQALAYYNVGALPTSVLIVDGSLSAMSIKGEQGLRKELDRLLK
ncbi:MAG: TlpA family protein disulfide reductase [Bacteroidales bacterium]|nr:TlpA family protein disulfide reductase [Bacteroidales bacterium]